MSMWFVSNQILEDFTTKFPATEWAPAKEKSVLSIDRFPNLFIYENHSYRCCFYLLFVKLLISDDDVVHLLFIINIKT